MGTNNIHHNDARIADLVWTDRANDSDNLDTTVEFDAPTDVTRSYRVPYDTAKEWLKKSI